ncbi:MAG: L,D-transpeptidase/peptidoglycan binding protein [Clostridium sp.]|nr:L,D-transpeptidase/peptidoglycan binding protein [Clostridium sp.]
MEIEKKKNNKVLLGIIISICGLGAVYLGTSLYFSNHFNVGSKINSIDVSGRTIDEADTEIMSQISSYELSLEGRNELEDTITADDINLQYNLQNKLQQIKDNQSALGWIGSLFKEENTNISDAVVYDDSKLDSKIDNLSVMDSKNIVEPKNAALEYNNGQYEIVEEVNGSKINKDFMKSAVSEAIKNGEHKLDLDESNCYERPKYTSKSKEVSDAQELMNKYVSTKITYNFNGGDEVIDGSLIKDWISVDDNYNVNIDEDKIKEYLNTLAKKYTTVGKTRSFTTTGGQTVSVSGGDYGTKIDVSEEEDYLVEAIKNGTVESKEPKYSQKAMASGENDIGNTYVEVSLSGQHLWFYKDGSLVVDGPVVTGNISNGTGTPSGTYKLDYKERNATLRGQGYATPVSYWMPFNGGIGIHDATWRGSFGGSIYVSGGSHGCVNAPYELAHTIFNSIDEGTPVVCYY